MQHIRKDWIRDEEDKGGTKVLRQGEFKTLFSRVLIWQSIDIAYIVSKI